MNEQETKPKRSIMTLSKNIVIERYFKTKKRGDAPQKNQNSGTSGKGGSSTSIPESARKVETLS